MPASASGPIAASPAERERQRVRQLGRQPPSVLVADVHGRGRIAVDEEPPLRLEVRLHVAVEVQMILAEIGEDERGEAHAVEPVQLRRMRRRLHRARAVARVEHLAEGPLQVDRLGRRAHDAAPLAADARLHRAEQPWTAAGRGEDGEEQERRRRLAARPGDAGHLELLRRPAEELVRRRRHRRARARDDELRHRQVERPLDDESHGAPLHRLRRELVTVGTSAGNAEEQRSGRRGTGVVDEVAHVDRSTSEHVDRAERCDEALQVHRSASLPAPAATGPARRAAPRGTGGRTRRSARTPAPPPRRRRWRGSARPP